MPGVHWESPNSNIYYSSAFVFSTCFLVLLLPEIILCPVYIDMIIHIEECYTQNTYDLIWILYIQYRKFQS